MQIVTGRNLKASSMERRKHRVGQKTEAGTDLCEAYPPRDSFDSQGEKKLSTIKFTCTMINAL